MSGRDELAAALRHAAAVPDAPKWRQRMRNQAEVILAAAPDLIVTTEAELARALSKLGGSEAGSTDPQTRAALIARAIREDPGDDTRTGDDLVGD